MQSLSQEKKNDFEDARKAFLESEKICIISHRSPDGDAVGSNLALRFQLEKLGKNVVSACVDPVPENSLFLKDADTFVEDFELDDFDLFVSVDCGDKKLVKFHETKPDLFSEERKFINIDHHESNDGFGDVNLVYPDDCSTCIVLYDLFEYCDWDLDRNIATCLLHGIYFDTGSLMHSNTNARVYETSGELLAKGADLKRVVKKLFRTTASEKLKLWGRIMERAYVNDEGVVVSAVNQSDYLACGASHHDTGGVIDFLNAVPGSKYCVLLSENDRGIVKGSLRTQRDDVNLSDVASQWGGGGHPRASGFGVEGNLQPVIKWQVVNDNGEGKKLEF